MKSTKLATKLATKLPTKVERRVVAYEMKYHLGDCLTQVHWMKKSCAIQDTTDFDFYCEPENHKECRIFAAPWNKRIRVLPYAEKPEEAIDCWIAPVLTNVIKSWPKLPGLKTFRGVRNYELDYTDVFMLLYQQVAKRAGLENPIKSKLDIVFELPRLVRKEDAPKGPFKYLIINAPSRTNEFDFEEQNWEWLLRHCAGQGNVICTHPNKAGVFSTLEHGWSVCDLGNVAHEAENVIAVHTGPLWPVINTRSMETVKFWLVCTHGHYFAYNERFHWARNFEAVKLKLAKEGLL